MGSTSPSFGNNTIDSGQVGGGVTVLYGTKKHTVKASKGTNKQIALVHDDFSLLVSA